MKRAGTSLVQAQACRRRLTWPQMDSGEQYDTLKGGKEACSSTHDAAVPHMAELGINTVSTPLLDKDATTGDSKNAAKSPIIGHALTATRRSVSRSDSPQQLLGCPTSPPAQQVMPSNLQQLGSGDIYAKHCQRVLAAAGSSSHGCTVLLCWGAALDQQQLLQEVEEGSATPDAMTCSQPPALPRKHVAQTVAKVGIRQSCRAARKLPGLAPTSDAELQQLRAWMAQAVQKVQ